MADKIKSYRDLIVWQKAMLLVDAVCIVVRAMLKEEYYILASQMLRAVISIPSNIAEGFRRKSKPEYMHHLTIALGSAAELGTQLNIVQSQYGKINITMALGLVDEVQRMLNSMTISYKS